MFLSQIGKTDPTLIKRWNKDLNSDEIVKCIWLYTNNKHGMGPNLDILFESVPNC